MVSASELNNDALVTQYLNVLNRALGENRDETPYKQLLAAAEKLFDDTTVAVGVYSDDPGNPHHWFTVAFRDGKFKLEEQGKGDADITWMARRAHLEEVVEDSSTYIAHPYKLDLDWLKKALGIGL